MTRLIGPTDAECATLIDLDGAGGGSNVTLRYWEDEDPRRAHETAAAGGGAAGLPARGEVVGRLRIRPVRRHCSDLGDVGGSGGTRGS